ncbi:MAG: SDR family NAD(P)-dependent oxidoreductase [Oligoflexus sp.]
MHLQSRKIVLTGAGSGIGRALLHELSKFEGVKILAVDCHEDAVQALEGKVWPYVCDISQNEALTKLFADAVSLLGGIDLFFANAGFSYYGDLGKPDWQKTQRIFATNVFSPIFILQQLLAEPKCQGFRLVITASAMGLLPMPGYALYGATKAAMVSFCQAMRYELPESVSLTVVYPIATRTRFFDHDGHRIPVPWPTQTPEHVARSIIKGLRGDRQDIFPSRLFRLTIFLQTYLPLIGRLYQLHARMTLFKWLKQKESSAKLE